MGITTYKIQVRTQASKLMAKPHICKIHIFIISLTPFLVYKKIKSHLLVKKVLLYLILVTYIFVWKEFFFLFSFELKQLLFCVFFSQD